MNKIVFLPVLVILLMADCSKKKDIESPYFLLESGEVNLIVPGEGGYADYTVSSNDQWKLVRNIPADTWAWSIPANGTGTGSFRITIAPNTSENERTMQFAIFLNDVKQTQEIVITQKGSEEIDDDGTVVDLGNRREIFVDSYLIRSLVGISLVLHHPVDRGIAFPLDKPWEGKFSIYSTIIRDGNIFRAYYRGYNGATVGPEVTAYAESTDGINWIKPNLRLFQVNGTIDNNVVVANAPRINHNFSPFLDVNPNAAPNQRYKAIAGTANGGLFAYVSPDGIHWQKLQEAAVFTNGLFDSQNVAFWSESEQCYLCYFRTWTEQQIENGLRTVGRTTSTDFIHWTDPVEMTFGNTLTEDLYTNQTAPYFRAPHIYLAIGARLMIDRQAITEEQGKELGLGSSQIRDCSDAFLMSSRGSNVYDRTFMESFIRPGIGAENWVTRTNYPALNVVQTGPAEMSIYVNNDYGQATNHMRRYSLRLDGFSSLAAPYQGGEAITRFFTFSGSELEINYSTSAPGEIRFEIHDEDGNPLPGFTLEDSQAIIGNEIARIVQWKSGKSLKELIGKKVRLRIVMKDADLYSIRFKD